jgi:peroxiredoxin
MPNRMTGKLDAVLQVSGSTVNRLLASMHQNAGSPKGLPAFPHSTFLRIGDDEGTRVDGVVGVARVQVSVPHLELVHGSRDRVVFHAWVRAHYLPDSGSTPLPQFVYGRVRVEYGIEMLGDPSQERMFYVMKPAPDGVSFTSEGPDTSADAAITRQIVALLQTTYQMTPHPVQKEFDHRRLRSLVAGGVQAVEQGLDLKGNQAVGGELLDDLNEIFLAGKDFGVAVSQEYILSNIQPTLDALKAASNLFFDVKITAKVPAWGLFGFLGWWEITVAEGTYRIAITQASAKWSGGPAGVITLDIQGTAVTPSILPNASFGVSHKLLLKFDPVTETLWIDSSDPPQVSADVSGPFGGFIEGRLKSEVEKQYKAQLAPGVASAQGKLGVLPSKKNKLVGQLLTIDDQAGAHLDTAEFNGDGLILRGTVSLAPRRTPHRNTKRLDDLSGFTAFLSWIPGGRIDKFEWRWQWFLSAQALPVPPPKDGIEEHRDRFLLLKTTVPLPGLPPLPDEPNYSNVPGAVCLRLRGVVVNPVTGGEDPVDTGFDERCLYFYPDPPLPPSSIDVAPRPRWWWKIWIAAGEGRSASARELAVVEVGAERARETTFNTLVHFAGDRPSREMLEALAEAVRSSGRADAGVLVVLLLRDGFVAAQGGDLAAALGGSSLETPVLVNEDVQGGWSTALGVSPQGGEATRLIAADGSVAWTSDGAIDVTAMAAALREHLIESPPPSFEPVELGVRTGQEAPDFSYEAAPGVRSRLVRLRGEPLTVSFVQPWSVSSAAELRHLERTRRGQRAGSVIAVVDRADASAVERLGREHRLSFPLTADPYGEIARSYAIRLWPTTIEIDATGRLTGVTVGRAAKG